MRVLVYIAFTRGVYNSTRPPGLLNLVNSIFFCNAKGFQFQTTVRKLTLLFVFPTCAGHFYYEQRRAGNALVYLDQTYDIFTALCLPRTVRIAM